MDCAEWRRTSVCSLRVFKLFSNSSQNTLSTGWQWVSSTCNSPTYIIYAAKQFLIRILKKMDFKNNMCMFWDSDIRLKWCYMNVWLSVRTYHYHSVQILTQEHFYRVLEQRWVQSQGSTQRVWCIWKDQSECRRRTKRRKNCGTLS